MLVIKFVTYSRAAKFKLIATHPIKIKKCFRIPYSVIPYSVENIDKIREFENNGVESTIKWR